MSNIANITPDWYTGGDPGAAFRPGMIALQQGLERNRQQQMLQSQAQTAYGTPDPAQGPPGGGAAPGGGGSLSPGAAAMLAMPGSGGGSAASMGSTPFASGDDDDPYKVPAAKTAALQKTLSLYDAQNANKFKSMGLEQLEGYIQGKQMQAANRMTTAKLQQMQAEADELQGRGQYYRDFGAQRLQQSADEAGTGDLIMGALQNMDSGGAVQTPGAAPAPGLSALQALSLSAQSHPRAGGRSLMGALNSMDKMQALQQSQQGQETPQFVTDPVSGQRFATFGRQMQASGADPSLAAPKPDLSDTPGVIAVPNGKGGWKTQKDPNFARPTVPPELHTALDGADDAIAKAQQQAKAAMAAGTPEGASSALGEIQSARARAQSVINRHAALGNITSAQRDLLLQQYGGLRTAGAANPATPGTARVTVRNAAGKTFTVPQAQLPQARQQGYTPVQ